MTEDWSNLQYSLAPNTVERMFGNFEEAISCTYRTTTNHRLILHIFLDLMRQLCMFKSNVEQNHLRRLLVAWLCQCYKSYSYPTKRTSGTSLNHWLLLPPIESNWLINGSGNQKYNQLDWVKSTNLWNQPCCTETYWKQTQWTYIFRLLKLSPSKPATGMNMKSQHVTGRRKSTTFVIARPYRHHHLLPCSAHHVTTNGKNLHWLAN
jgi:hypothetical protein